LSDYPEMPGREDLETELNSISAKNVGSFQMGDTLTFLIWGAVVATTRAFKKVSLKIDTNTNRIFISVQLAWWAKFPRLSKFRDLWLRKAESACKSIVPEGWRTLVYYER